MTEEIVPVNLKIIGNYTEFSMNIQHCRKDVNLCRQERRSSLYLISNNVYIQFRTLCMGHRSNSYRRDTKNMLMISFHNNTDYRVLIHCPQWNVCKKDFRIIDNIWFPVYESCEEIKIPPFTANIEVIPPASLCCNLIELYEDTELTDFVLEGVDGSVSVHKAILASCSPVLRRMITGPWRESAQGRIKFADTTYTTLEHFKKFLYADTLPDEGLEHLVALASMYDINGLEKRVTDKLFENLTAASASDLLDNAFKHKLRTIQLGVLERIQMGFISVASMKEYWLRPIEEEKQTPDSEKKE